MKPLKTESEIMTVTQAERIAAARLRAAIAAVAAARAYNGDVQSSIEGLPYDVLGEEYKRDPEAACRKALRLTRRIAKLSLRLRAIDRLLGMHGVESTHTRNGEWGFSYANTGDSYASTVILFASGAFRVSSWGDIVERNYSRYA